MTRKTLIQNSPMSRTFCLGAGLIVACNTFASVVSSEPASSDTAGLESGNLASGAFELVMITAGDQLRSISFALGNGDDVQISSGYIHANGGEDAFTQIDNDSEVTLNPGQEFTASFSRVIIFGEQGTD